MRANHVNLKKNNVFSLVLIIFFVVIVAVCLFLCVVGSASADSPDANSSLTLQQQKKYNQFIEDGYYDGVALDYVFKGKVEKQSIDKPSVNASKEVKSAKNYTTTIENLEIYKGDGVTKAIEGKSGTDDCDYYISTTKWTDYAMINIKGDDLILKGNGQKIDYGLTINSDGLSHKTTLDNTNFSKTMTSEYICNVNTVYQGSPSDYQLCIKGDCTFRQVGPFEWAPYGTIGVEGEGSLYIQDAGSSSKLTIGCEDTDPFAAPIMSFANLHLGGNVQYDINSHTYGIALPYDWYGKIKHYSLYFEDNSNININSTSQRGILIENPTEDPNNFCYIKDNSNVTITSLGDCIKAEKTKLFIQDTSNLNCICNSEGAAHGVYVTDADCQITTSGTISFDSIVSNMHNALECTNGDFSLSNSKLIFNNCKNGIIANSNDNKGNVSIDTKQDVSVTASNLGIQAYRNMDIISGNVDIATDDNYALSSGVSTESDLHLDIGAKTQLNATSTNSITLAGLNSTTIYINSGHVYLSGYQQFSDKDFGAIACAQKTEPVEDNIIFGESIKPFGSDIVNQKLENVKDSVANKWVDSEDFPASTFFINSESNEDKVAKTLVFTSAKEITSAEVKGEYSYTGDQIKPSVNDVVVYDEYGDLIDSSKYELDYGENINSGKDAGSVTINSISWKTTGQITITFDIAKASQDIDAPTLKSSSATSLEVNNIKSGYGDTQYAISKDIFAPESGWQESTIFEDLKENSTYYIFAKYTGDDNHEAAVSTATESKTKSSEITEFNIYKSDKITLLMSMKNDGDSQKVTNIIDDAIAEVEALEYDSSLNLEENKAKVDKIVSDAKSAVDKQRKEDQKKKEDDQKKKEEDQKKNEEANRDVANVDSVHSAQTGDNSVFAVVVFTLVSIVCGFVLLRRRFS